jgi:hypothetical protein
LLARVRHPHVITVYGAEPRDGAVGIWMEFIRGKTLHQIVDQQGAMSAREAAASAPICAEHWLRCTQPDCSTATSPPAM